MISTTQTKLSKLIDTKNKIRQTLILLGVDVPIDTPFASYPDFMDELGNMETTETTTDQDLLQLLDLYYWLGSAEYEDHVYTDEEIQAIHDLLDKINNGEPEAEELPEIISPYLIVIPGDTTYYSGDVFNSNGYIIKAVYPDGTISDVTKQCTFSPTTPLNASNEVITISYVTDDMTLTYSQSIKVRKLLEYIRSTGTQYIDTGVIPKSTTRLVMKLKYNDITRRQQHGWGSSGSKESFFMGIDGTNLEFIASVSNSYKVIYTGISADSNVHIFDIKRGSQKLDGIEYGAEDTIGDTATTGQTLYLFAMHAEWNSIPNDCCDCDVQYCKIYDGDTLVRDYIPSADPDDVACLYDKVTKAFYYNKGSGLFVAGPEVQVKEDE